MQKNMIRNRIAWAACFFLFASCFMAPTFAQSAKEKPRMEGKQGRLARQVRNELILLPYYSVFDNLTYRIERGNSIVLMGQVVKPILKQYAESAVRGLEGVRKVVNKIEVLPLSPNDDSLRRAVFRAIYSRDGFEHYALSAVPSIHIIVNNGNITLEGVAANQMDKDIAGLAANQVSGAFSVTNNLRLEAN
jgi:hyperosmotically inducible protein